MNHSAKLLAVRQGCEETIEQAAQLLSNAGLQTVRTFDLRSARVSLAACACPYHGTAACNCQLVMFLVYGSGQTPVTLVAYGRDGQTWFSVVDTPRQPADLQLEAAIEQALAPDNFAHLNHLSMESRRKPALVGDATAD